MTAATWPAPNSRQIARFLELLGKPKGTVRLRAFFPSGDARKDSDGGRKGKGDLAKVEQWQREGRGVYAVVNDGGDNDREITACRAVFCEWDDRSIEWQEEAWVELGLPEPTFMVATGGKSVHCYWALVEPISAEDWRPLQRALLEHADADRSISNPARVMRLPGCWYMHPDNQPGELVQIIHESGKRYSTQEITACLPARKKPHPPTAKATVVAPVVPVENVSAVLLQQLLPKDLEDLVDRGAPEGQRNAAAFKLAASALAVAAAAAAAGLHVVGTPEELVLAYAARCAPPMPEREAFACLRSAADQPRQPDPGWLQRLRFWLNRNTQQQRHQPRPVAGEQQTEASPTGLPWLLQRLDTGHGPRGGEKLNAGELAQTLLEEAGERLQFNEMTMLAEIDGQPVEGADLETLHVELQLRGMNVTAEAAVDALAAAANRRRYHPVRTYLSRVESDPNIVPIDLTELVGRFLRPGDPAGTLHSRLLAKTLIAAVARALNPGCKVDTCCVLAGEQGAMKSSFWEGIAGKNFYTCSGLGRLDKDSLLLVHSCWFLEAAELETITTKKAAGELKNFLSTAIDAFRAPYARCIQRRPRPSVMVGTSNRTDFLTDDTGSRRFWIIPVTASEIDVEGVRALRDSIWKAAVLAYRAGERWWLDKADAAASARENQDFAAGHPWEAPVASWLDRQGGVPFTTIECLTNTGLRDRAQITRRDEMALAGVLAALGWKQERVRQGARKVRVWLPPTLAQPHPAEVGPEVGPRDRSGDQGSQQMLGNGGPTSPKKVGPRDRSQGNGSQSLAQPAQPQTRPLRARDEAAAEGAESRGGAPHSKGTKKGWAGWASAETPVLTGVLAGPTSGPTCPEVGPEVGPGWAGLQPGDPVELLNESGTWSNGWRLACIEDTSIGARARIEAITGSAYRIVPADQLRPCPSSM